MVLQSELEMPSRVDAGFNLFEESDAQLNCTSTGAATTGSAWRSRECRQTAGSINSAIGSPIWHSRSRIGRSGRTSIGAPRTQKPRMCTLRLQTARR
jgi:hypothetical protein